MKALHFAINIVVFDHCFITFRTSVLDVLCIERERESMKCDAETAKNYLYVCSSAAI